VHVVVFLKGCVELTGRNLARPNFEQAMNVVDFVKNPACPYPLLERIHAPQGGLTTSTTSGVL
jgi:hypothetical protein